MSCSRIQKLQVEIRNPIKEVRPISGVSFTIPEDVFNEFSAFHFSSTNTYII